MWSGVSDFTTCTVRKGTVCEETVGFDVLSVAADLYRSYYKVASLVCCWKQLSTQFMTPKKERLLHTLCSMDGLILSNKFLFKKGSFLQVIFIIWRNADNTKDLISLLSLH